jgi:hypothetical protein
MIPKNPESFRRNIQKKLSEKIGDDESGSIGLNLEKGIYIYKYVVNTKVMKTDKLTVE